MTFDLERALHAAVDDGTGTHPPLGGPAGTAALRARVRRRRAARTAGRATVGAGAACAVGLGAIGWQRAADAPPPAASASSSAPDGSATTPKPVLPARPVTPTTSALCGVAVADLPDDPGDVTLSLGLPGVVVDAGQLVGRSVGDSVPVWLTVPADAGGTRTDPSAEYLATAEILLVQDDAVVAVADSAASVLSVDDPTATMLERAQAGTSGTGDLHACPGTAPDGLAGAVPAAGEYELRAVGELTQDGGGLRRVVSQPVPVTLLPEQELLHADADGLPADFPLAAVPLIGDRVLAASSLPGGTWQVTVPADGTDALHRAADALGAAIGDVLWDRLTGSSGSGGGAEIDLSGAAPGAQEAALVLGGARAARMSDDQRGGPFTAFSWGGGSFSVTTDALEIDVTEQSGPGGANSLVYRVTPR
jgi:hypothetical protein